MFLSKISTNYCLTKRSTKSEITFACAVFCFSSEDILKSHTEDCLVINGEQAVRMPKEDSKIKFTNDYKQEPVPYVIYADFEILVEKVAICKPHETRSYSESYQSHK